MEKGIVVRLSGDYDSAVFELERLCADGGGAWQDTSDEVSFPKGCRHGTAFAVQKQLVESLIRHSESESVKGLKL
jgi:hypothetical protein